MCNRSPAPWWDRGGLVIVYKRLEAGVFELPTTAADQSHVTLGRKDHSGIYGSSRDSKEQKG
ncbi:MAG: IS66 family insertion sequence element accessory protein TnpB [Planctomycetota bacterium]